MAAQNDIDLLPNCCDFMLPVIAEAEKEAFNALQTSGSTVLVDALRSFRLHRAVIAVGMFSMYESALQTEFGWSDPFKQLPLELTAKGNSELALRFRRYARAINVLKHGDGKSLAELLKEQDLLEFRIKSPGSLFEDDGDVSEGQHYVDADNEFVRGCADVIELTLNVVRDQK